MQNMTSLSIIVHKFWPRLKFLSQTHAENLMPRIPIRGLGHKKTHGKSLTQMNTCSTCCLNVKCSSNVIPKNLYESTICSGSPCKYSWNSFLFSLAVFLSYNFQTTLPLFCLLKV